MGNRPQYLIIHHSAGPRNQTAMSIRSYHMTPEAQGGPRGGPWTDIGYHRVIEQDGTVRQGRADDQDGAHAPGYNDRSLGICVVGDFTKYPINVNHHQYKALIWTLVVLCKRYSIPVARIIGHKDTKVTACPGSIYAALPAIRQAVANALSPGTKETPMDPKSPLVSKTLWFNGVAALAALLTWAAQNSESLRSFVPAEFFPILVALITIGNFVLRYVTKQPIS